MVLPATPNLTSSGLRLRCITAAIENESMALMQCPSVLSARHEWAIFTLKCYIEAATHDEEVRCGAGSHLKSAIIRQRSGCSTSNIENHRIAFMLRASLLFAPTLLGHFFTLNAMLQVLQTIRRLDVAVAATPNQASSGQPFVSCCISALFVVGASSDSSLFSHYVTIYFGGIEKCH